MGWRGTLEILDDSAIGPDLDRAIRDLLCRCFPADVEAFAGNRAWHGERPAWVVVATAPGGVVGHVAIVVRTARFGETSVEVAGVQGMSVSPECQGQGLASQLMREAMAEALRRGVRVGMLFCVPALEEFYCRLGWQKTDRPVTFLDERGRPVLLVGKNIAMLWTKEEAEDHARGEILPPGPIALGCRDW